LNPVPALDELATGGGEGLRPPVIDVKKGIGGGRRVDDREFRRYPRWVREASTAKRCEAYVVMRKSRK
jgi:hypothetical protein